MNTDETQISTDSRESVFHLCSSVAKKSRHLTLPSGAPILQNRDN